MSRKNMKRRKRTFGAMCSSPIIIEHHLSPSLFCIQSKSTKARPTKYYNFNNHYTFNFNFKCDYIDNNPKPCKRIKLSHSSRNQCNTKCMRSKKRHRATPNTTVSNHTHISHKTRPKTPILHHCVINERWNMLMSLDPNPPKAKKAIHSILNILNEFNNDANPARIHLGRNMDAIAVIESETNPSIDYKHGANVSLISFQENIPETHDDTCSYIYSSTQSTNIWPQNTHSTTNTVNMSGNAWNHAHYTPYKEDLHSCTRYKPEIQCVHPLKVRQNRSYSALKYLCFVVLCAICWKYGIFMRFGAVFICDKSSKKHDEKHMRSDINENKYDWNQWLVLKWMLVMMITGIFCHVLYVIYNECYHEGDRKKFKVGFDRYKKENVTFKRCNTNHYAF